MKKIKKCETTHKKRSDSFGKRKFDMERIKKIWNP